MGAAESWDRDAELGASGALGGDEVERWQAYERAKRQLAQLGLAPGQYEARIQLIAAELGL